jgi:hypothetical protein
VQALLDGASDLTAQVNDYIQATKDIEAQTEDIVRDLIEIGDAALGAADKWKQAVDDFLGFELKLPEFPELPNVPGFPETPEPPDLIPFKNQLEEIRGLVDDPFGAVKEQATRGIPVVGQFKIVEQAAKRAQDAIDAAGNATGTFDLPELPKINGELKSLRDSMTDLRSPDVIDRAAIIAQGGEARRAGAALGQEIGKGLTEGIEDEQETAVEAARRNVREVAAAGREAVADAIRQAQRNLASLGSELASQATAVLDASGPERRIEQLEDEAAAAAANAQRGRLRAAVTTAQANLEEALRNAPVERRIRELQESLARDERGAGRVDLNRSLRDAREALREAQSQAQVAGDLDPRQRAQTARFLRPFREAVADAKGDIKTFNKEATIESLQAKLTGQTDAITENINGLRDALTGARQALVDSQKEFATKGLIDSLRKTATAQKLAVEQGIADSIQAFNDGLITLPELNRRLAKLLAANGVDYRKSGGQLGTAFVRGFEASLAGLSTQAKAILAGPRAPGTGLDADIVSPAAARRDAASANLNARQGVTDALLKESETQTGVLREILAAQTAGRGRPTTTPTAAQRGNAPTGPRP